MITTYLLSSIFTKCNPLRNMEESVCYPARDSLIFHKSAVCGLFFSSELWKQNPNKTKFTSTLISGGFIRKKRFRVIWRVRLLRQWKPRLHTSSVLKVKFSIHSLSSPRLQRVYVPYRSRAAEMLMDGWLGKWASGKSTTLTEDEVGSI